MWAWTRRLLTELAVQDWFVLGYLMVLFFAVAIAPESAARTMNLQRLSALLVVSGGSIVAVRGNILTRPLLGPLFYRLSILLVLVASYLMLQGLLPVVSSRVLDSQLYQLDLKVFGVEPALWMDQFVTPATTEWFSFFYYSYFFVLGAYVLPYVFAARDYRRFEQFGLGFMGTYCIAHVLYMVVPGFGPYRFLADEFQNALPMGFWYERVLEAVQSAGAQKDIFPSLHTAGPVFCFIFAFRHRHVAPFKYVWHITGFFALNIIIATMFLRWHYLIDIVAGLMLAGATNYGAYKIATYERSLRARRALQPVWPELNSARDNSIGTGRETVSAG